MKRSTMFWVAGCGILVMRLAYLANPQRTMLPMQDTTFLSAVSKCPVAVITNTDLINSAANSPKGKPNYGFTITKPSVVSLTTIASNGDKKVENTLVTSSTSFGRIDKVVEIGCVPLNLDEAYNKASSTAPQQLTLKEETNKQFEKYQRLSSNSPNLTLVLKQTDEGYKGGVVSNTDTLYLDGKSNYRFINLDSL
jgi:hypothetical protein